MKKLKVGVDIRGIIFFMEQFPDDEEHAGLDELLAEAHGELDGCDVPGIYLATFQLGAPWRKDPSDYEPYLEIEHMEPIK